MRAFYGFLTVLLAGITFATGCGKLEKEIPERVVKVVAQPLQTRHFAHKYKVQANAQPKEKATISSRIAGTLDELGTDTGRKVKKGDVLFKVDHENLKNDLLVQEAKLEVAKTDLSIAKINSEIAKIVMGKAQRDYERYKTLFESKTVSEDAYERQNVIFRESVSSWEKALAQERYVEAQVRQELASLAIDQKKFNDSISTAPFDATVIDKKQERGEYVSIGSAIFKLSSEDRLELSSRVIASYYNQIKPGVTKAIIYTMDGDKIAEGVVGYISPNVDELTRTFEFTLDLPRDAKLVSGMLCQVELILSERDSVGVPTAAILSRANNSKIVYVVRNGLAEPVEVKPGLATDDYTEILNPKDLDGADVVVQGQVFLSKGDKVSFVESEPQTESK